MRLIGIIIAFCVALAVFQALITALLIVFAILLTWGLLFNTREMLGSLAFAAMFALLKIYPIPCLIVAVMALIYFCWPRRHAVEPQAEPKLLTWDEPEA